MALKGVEMILPLKKMGMGSLTVTIPKKVLDICNYTENDLVQVILPFKKVKSRIEGLPEFVEESK